MAELRSLGPIVDESSRVLILGSMPGTQSINEKRYYANRRNHFWKIIYLIFDCKIDPSNEPYEHRVQFVRERGIALWDVIEKCFREGSLDSNIREAIPNNFKSFFKQYPKLKYVIFNGSKACESFKKLVGFDYYAQYVFKRLPSTSPANAISFESKLKDWAIIKDCLSS